MARARWEARRAELEARFRDTVWYRRATAILAEMRDCGLRRAIEARCQEHEQQAKDHAADAVEDERDPYAHRGLFRKDFL